VIPGYEIVDLSLPVAEDLPCSWPGDVDFRHSLVNWYTPTEDAPSFGPYHTKLLQLNEHTATHLDAPAHWIPPPDSGLPNAGPRGETTSDRIPLEQLTGPAAVVDATGLLPADDGVSPEIGVELIETFERDHGAIEAGEIVLLRTGWDRHYLAGDDGRRWLADAVTAEGPAWPAPTADAVVSLYDRGVRCIGIDTPSIGAAENGDAAHFAGLSRGVVYIEGLAGLGRLPPRGALFLFLPLSIRGGTGAPGRAIALLGTA
jgi:kynurenine formamidase